LGVLRSDVAVAREVGRVCVELGGEFPADVALNDSLAGFPVGDDVGYGPTHMFPARETHAMYEAMLAQSMSTFVARCERTFDVARGEDPYESLEAVIHARVVLAAYLRLAKTSFRALLVWSD
jgi:hypothetical protein